jgi:hypothetical protein
MGTVAKFVDRFRAGTLESLGDRSSLDLQRTAEHDPAVYEKWACRRSANYRLANSTVSGE